MAGPEPDRGRNVMLTKDIPFGMNIMTLAGFGGCAIPGCDAECRQLALTGSARYLRIRRQSAVDRTHSDAEKSAQLTPSRLPTSLTALFRAARALDFDMV